MSRGILAQNLTGVAVLLGLLLACSKSGGGGGLNSFKIPWPTASGEYQIQNVELATLSEPRRLQGSAAVVRASPLVTEDGLRSSDLSVRYLEADSALVPADAVTLQVTAMYAHIEKLAQLDQNVGMGEVLPKPRLVGVNVEATVDGSDGILINNAFYDGSTDSLMVTPFEGEGLPLSVNAGVIAHEYFHSLFFHSVRKALPNTQLSVGIHCAHFHADAEVETEAGTETSDQVAREIKAVDTEIYNQFMVRAMDEGLADFWAWVYTGDDRFISRSLPDHGESRRLDKSFSRFSTAEQLSSISVKSGDDIEVALMARAYRMGTNYARYFRQLAHTLELHNTAEKRQTMAKYVLKMVRLLAPRLASVSGAGQFISPDLPIEIFLAQNPELSTLICELSRQVTAKPIGACPQ